MPKRVSKSRTYAVVLTAGDTLGAYFIHKKTVTEDGHEPVTSLELDAYPMPTFSPKDENAIIELLMKAGLTVRHFDKAERQWMDNSLLYGVVRAPGTRDGTWGPPLTVDEFEKDYLNVL